MLKQIIQEKGIKDVVIIGRGNENDYDLLSVMEEFDNIYNATDNVFSGLMKLLLYNKAEKSVLFVINCENNYTKCYNRLILCHNLFPNSIIFLNCDGAQLEIRKAVNNYINDYKDAKKRFFWRGE
jgi:hypothetical protein